MPDRTIPRRDSDLLAFSGSFSARINADPGMFQLSVGQASAYAALQLIYADLYRVANAPSTNSHANIIAKNEARAALEAETRQLVRIIRANAAIPNDDKAKLGIHLPDGHLTPVGRPVSPPFLSVVGVSGQTVRLRLGDTDSPHRRGKPDGVTGAAVLYTVGPKPPASPSEWRIAGHFSRTLATVHFPAEVAAGESVWLTAYWLSTRAKASPASNAVNVRPQGGMARLAA